jgi:hypothetical protein
MKCKICGAYCIETNKSYSSYYCETYPDKDGGHYTMNKLIFSNTSIEKYKYNDFVIYKYYDHTTKICTDVFIYKMNKPYEKMTHINISKEAFEKMNFDPKNPKPVLDKLELLKCFY